MNPIANKRHARHTAMVVLFVWLMTLGIGVADACLPDQALGRHSEATHFAAEAPEAAVKQQQPSDEAGCLNFCVTAQVTAIKTNQLDGGVVLGLLKQPPGRACSSNAPIFMAYTGL